MPIWLGRFSEQGRAAIVAGYFQVPLPGVFAAVPRLMITFRGEVVENKGIGLSFVMLLITAIIIVLVMKGVSGLISGGMIADMGDDAVLARIQPVGNLNTGAPIVAAAPAAAAAPAKASATRTGEQVYNASCQACHATGAAGAPKLGDKAAWSPRIKQGMDTLMTHALNGFNAMPARGTCGNCSDEEIKSAIEFMIAKSK
jgi:cytochrome c5